jgi:hypothetical protein
VATIRRRSPRLNVVDDPSRLSPRRDQHLAQPGELLQRQLFTGGGVALAHQDHRAFAEERLAIEPGRGAVEGPDDQVHRAHLQLPRRELRPERDDAQAHPGRALGQPFEERREQDELAKVGGGQGEDLIAARGIEASMPDEGAIQIGQDALEHRPHGQRPRGRGEAAPGAHEQRISGGRAQAAQGVAGRRLAEADPGCGSGDATLAEERVEETQLSQLHRGELHVPSLAAQDGTFIR